MLQRKNIMIEENFWKSAASLSEIKDISISNVIAEAVATYLKTELENNLLFKVRMIAENNTIAMSAEEETEILTTLANMTPEDREIASEETL